MILEGGKKEEKISEKKGGGENVELGGEMGFQRGKLKSGYRSP